MKFVWQDIRLSIRVLLKSPGFAIVAVITLALAIGANAIVFAVINGLILRPLDLAQEDRLYQVERGKDKNGFQSYPDYTDMRDRNHSFDELMAFTAAVVGIDTGSEPASAWIMLVTGNYFDGLRLKPQLGQFFHRGDEHGPNSAPYIVLSYPYWSNHFHQDQGVVGRVVQLNKHPYTILGVAPRDFHGTIVFFSPDFFVPIVNTPELQGDNDMNNRGKRWVFCVLGHLKDGVTPAQSISELNVIGGDLQKTYPKDDTDMVFALGRPGLYGDYWGPPIKAFLGGLMVLSGLILVAACTNLGSLFAARSAARSAEVSIRLALGSSYGRILQQLLLEAMLISIVGGIIGVSISVVLLRALSVWQPFSRYPLHVPVTPDGKVYAVAVLLSVGSAFLFGAVPVRQVLRTNPYEVIKSATTGVLRRRLSLRDLLLVVQIAICALLVTSSLVAVRGLTKSLHSDFGFDPQNVVLADTDLKMAGYGEGRATAMQKRMVTSMERIPGVETVGLVNPAPLYAAPEKEYVFLDKAAELTTAHAAAHSITYRISPNYLHAAGTSLLLGRDLTEHDDEKAPRVAIVNPKFAKAIFGSLSNAVGEYFKLQDGSRIQVVGVVEQGKYNYLTEEDQMAMFLPILQSPSSETWMVVRSRRNLQDVAPLMRNTFQELDSSLPVYIQTWTKELDHPLFGARMATMSLAVLAGIAALLCITGIFGTAAYSVNTQLHQLGIRMALGAQRTHVLKAALGRLVGNFAAGSLAGLVLGIMGSQVLSHVVYEANFRDPTVLFGVIFAMLLLGLLGAWIPAQRALSVAPLSLLRE